ncbi:hypothetical protein C8F01DRAFT_1084595 [Mycena amicta]|nr:hypothetical protein C8F01DRAFT_1084595 [Mycena amicta]
MSPTSEYGGSSASGGSNLHSHAQAHSASPSLSLSAVSASASSPSSAGVAGLGLPTPPPSVPSESLHTHTHAALPLPPLPLPPLPGKLEPHRMPRVVLQQHQDSGVRMRTGGPQTVVVEELPPGILLLMSIIASYNSLLPFARSFIVPPASQSQATVDREKEKSNATDTTYYVRVSFRTRSPCHGKLEEPYERQGRPRREGARGLLIGGGTRCAHGEGARGLSGGRWEEVGGTTSELLQCTVIPTYGREQKEKQKKKRKKEKTTEQYPGSPRLVSNKSNPAMTAWDFVPRRAGAPNEGKARADCWVGGGTKDEFNCVKALIDVMNRAVKLVDRRGCHHRRRALSVSPTTTTAVINSVERCHQQRGGERLACSHSMP